MVVSFGRICLSSYLTFHKWIETIEYGVTYISVVMRRCVGGNFGIGLEDRGTYVLYIFHVHSQMHAPAESRPYKAGYKFSSSEVRTLVGGGGVGGRFFLVFSGYLLNSVLIQFFCSTYVHMYATCSSLYDDDVSSRQLVHATQKSLKEA